MSINNITSFNGIREELLRNSTNFKPRTETSVVGSQTVVKKKDFRELTVQQKIKVVRDFINYGITNEIENTKANRQEMFNFYTGLMIGHKQTEQPEQTEQTAHQQVKERSIEYQKRLDRERVRQQMVYQARAMRSRGCTLEVIAKQLGVSRPTVSKMLQARS